MKEHRIESHLAREVKRLGGTIRKVKWPSVRGAPDRFVMWPALGVSHWIELKQPGGVPEPHQQREHDRLRAAGNSVFVLDTVDAVDMYLFDIVMALYPG